MSENSVESSSHFSLRTEHIVKRYGGVVALSDGTLQVQSGEVVALLGANGSGKSTLSKIITGVTAPNEGTLLLNEQPVHFANPQAARKYGIAAVYQELSLIPDMTVAENIGLTHEPLRWGVSVNRRALNSHAQRLIDLFGGVIAPTLEARASVLSLSPGERQIVEILKVISQEPRLIILDEATASLDSRQVARLFELIGQWKKQGTAIVFVSHRMDEIFQIADRAVVLRNGKTVADTPLAQTTRHDILQFMIAGSITERAPTERAVGGSVHLAVANLTARAVHDLSFEVHQGELLGLGGLQGQGQSELLLALFGALPFTGQVTLHGQAIHFRHPQDAIQQEVAFVPGDRGSEGLLLIRSILENFHLPSWARYGTPLNIPRARQAASQTAADLNLKMSSLDAPVNSLSGGNAQKVVIGKWLLRSPKLLLLNDPTKGIDVGAKAEFYRLLDALRTAGTAILFYSSDDDELLGLCDRILVLHDGQIAAELSGESLDRAHLVDASMGHHTTAAGSS